MSDGDRPDGPVAPPTGPRPGPGGLGFWVTAVVGASVVAVAARSLWLTPGDRARRSAVRFLLGAGVVHDALWAPVVAGAALLTAVLLPPWARRPVRIGLAFSALLVLLSWPAVRGYGLRANNPSLLPLDYGRNLAVLLIALWAAVAVGLAARAVQVVRTRRR